MNVFGNCNCNNIQFTWYNPIGVITPRACQCDYCLSKSAAYATQANTALEINIDNNNHHRVVQHGSNAANFHECSYCDQVVFVTAEIEGEIYGAVNAKLIAAKDNFLDAVELNFSYQSSEQKRQRWKQNWCHPITINK